MPTLRQYASKNGWEFQWGGFKADLYHDAEYWQLKLSYLR